MRLPATRQYRTWEISIVQSSANGAGSSMMMHLQVADIHRPLLSLSRAADQGFRSHLDWYRGYLEDVKTGETIPIQRRGNLYIMQTWVRASPENRLPDPSSGFARRANTACSHSTSHMCGTHLRSGLQSMPCDLNTGLIQNKVASRLFSSRNAPSIRIAGFWEHRKGSDFRCG